MSEGISRDTTLPERCTGAITDGNSLMLGNSSFTTADALCKNICVYTHYSVSYCKTELHDGCPDRSPMHGIGNFSGVIIYLIFVTEHIGKNKQALNMSTCHLAPSASSKNAVLLQLHRADDLPISDQSGAVYLRPCFELPSALIICFSDWFGRHGIGQRSSRIRTTINWFHVTQQSRLHFIHVCLTMKISVP